MTLAQFHAEQPGHLRSGRLPTTRSWSLSARALTRPSRVSASAPTTAASRRSLSQFGPENTAYATTSPNGTGEAFVQLLTAQEQSQLGCDRGHPCSLVIEPAQGGNIFTSPPTCNDHSQDLGPDRHRADRRSPLRYGYCSWKTGSSCRCTFAPTPTDCPVHNPDFSVIGSPMLARAMSSWQTALCTSSQPRCHPVRLSPERAAGPDGFHYRDRRRRADDAAASGAASRKHPFTYAPVAISAESVAFWIDNPATGKPLTHLKLDPGWCSSCSRSPTTSRTKAAATGRVHQRSRLRQRGRQRPESRSSPTRSSSSSTRMSPTVGDGFQVPTVLSGAERHDLGAHPAG